MYGRGLEFLDFSLSRIEAQSYRNLEIVVSDHSRDDALEALIKRWEQRSDLSFRYLRNTKERGNSSVNLNNALQNASGVYVKILFQDDFLYGEDAIAKTVAALEADPAKHWLVSACAHSKDGVTIGRRHRPSYHDDIYLGHNTISSPSVVMIRRERCLRFDPKLIWLMDVDFYKRMVAAHALPVFLNEVTVVNRVWEGQLTQAIPAFRKAKEVKWLRKRYEPETRGTLSWLRRTLGVVYRWIPMDRTGAERIYADLCAMNFEPAYGRRRGIVDINEHLPTLRAYAAQCEHVTEFGVRFAVSTHAFLISGAKDVVAYDLNPHFLEKYKGALLRFAKACGCRFRFKVQDVLDAEISETDLLFIDTLHTYAQLSAELAKHQSKVRKWMILHDTETFGWEDEVFYSDAKVSGLARPGAPDGKAGLRPALDEFLLRHPEWRVQAHYANNNGLTVIQRCACVL